VALSFDDAGDPETFTLNIDWGDLVGSLVWAATSPSTVGHTYDAVDNYAVSASVTDGDGGGASQSTTVAVLAIDATLHRAADELTALGSTRALQTAVSASAPTAAPAAAERSTSSSPATSRGRSRSSGKP
jgi:hypothetical protein